MLVGTHEIFGQNLTLIDYELFPCDTNEMSFYGLYQTRIISEEFRGDTLDLRITTFMSRFDVGEGSISIIGDTINLISQQRDSIPVLDKNGDTLAWIDEFCECIRTCSFDMTYQIKGAEMKDYIVKFNGKRIEVLPDKYKPATIEMNGNDTIRKTDDRGYYYYYTYYEPGKLRSIMKMNRYYQLLKVFYKSGQLKYERERSLKGSHPVYTEYDKEGNVIKTKTN